MIKFIIVNFECEINDRLVDNVRPYLNRICSGESKCIIFEDGYHGDAVLSDDGVLTITVSKKEL